MAILKNMRAFVGGTAAIRRSERCTGKGFSFPELLVILLIAAVMMRIAIPSVTQATRDNSLTTAENSVALIANLAESSFQSTGTYAQPASDLAAVFESKEHIVNVVTGSPAQSRQPTQVAIVTGCFNNVTNCQSKNGASWMALVADAYNAVNPKTSVCVYENLASSGQPAKWQRKDARLVSAPKGTVCTPADLYGTMVAIASSSTSPTTTVVGGVSGSGAAPLKITTPPGPADMPPAEVGTSYSATVTATGGGPPYDWSASGLPPGLTISTSSGAIVGAPRPYPSPIDPTAAPYPATCAGTDPVICPVTVTVVDASGQQASQMVTISVAPTVTFSPSACAVTSSLPVGEVGIPYSGAVQGCGGVGSYQYVVSGGTLPVGLSLDASTGAVTGTPTAAGAQDFTVTMRDSQGGISSQADTIQVNSRPVLCNEPSGGAAQQLALAEVGVPYSQTLTGCNGTAPYSFTVTGGSLPPGVTLGTSSGTVSGTPGTPGTYTAEITVTDGVDQTSASSQPVSIVVDPAPSVCNEVLPTGEVGVAYSGSVQGCSGSDAGYTFSGSGMPSWMALNASTGTISGIPTASGAISFDVTVTDSYGGTGTKTEHVTIDPDPTICATNLPRGEIYVAYSGLVTACGGSGTPWSYSATGLPPGLSIDPSTGAVNGTPTKSGTWGNVVFSVSDKIGGTASSSPQTITIDTSPKMNAASAVCGSDPLGPGEDGVPYSATLSGCNNLEAPYTFSLVGGVLPTGLSLSPSGTISGTPETNAPDGGKNWPFTVEVTDALGGTGIENATLHIYSHVQICSFNFPPGGEVAAYYTGSATGCQGDTAGTYSYSATGLPACVAMNASSGVASGTVCNPYGGYTITVTVTDVLGGTVSQSQSVYIYSEIGICGGYYPQQDVGYSYSGQVSACGGTGNYTFTDISSAPGTYIYSNGAISGYAAQVGAFPEDATVCDQYECQSGVGGMVDINPDPYVSYFSADPQGEVNLMGWYASAGAGGGTGGSYISQMGSWPAGTWVNGSEETPYSSGSYSLAVEACDSLGHCSFPSYASTYIYTQLSACPSFENGPSGQADMSYSWYFGSVGCGGTGSYSQSPTFTNGVGLDGGRVSVSGYSVNGTWGNQPPGGDSYGSNVMVTDSLGAKANFGFDIFVQGPLSVAP
jgi:Tfp pilus assembly protein PilE